MLIEQFLNFDMIKFCVYLPSQVGYLLFFSICGTQFYRIDLFYVLYKNIICYCLSLLTCFFYKNIHYYQTIKSKITASKNFILFY